MSCRDYQVLVDRGKSRGVMCEYCKICPSILAFSCVYISCVPRLWHRFWHSSRVSLVCILQPTSYSFKMRFSSTFAAVVGFFALSIDAITLTTTDAAYTIDTEATNAFIVSVKRSSCDITSIKYLGSEVQYQSTYSHISSGLGTATVTATSITCKFAEIIT